MAKQLLSAAKKWGTLSTPEFDTYIPSLEDAANIEDAFKLFMYGQTTEGDSVDQTNSLYYHMKSIKTLASNADTNVNSHSGASSNVHNIGSESSVVGTTTTQTLSNKTLLNPVISGNITGATSISSTLVSAGTVTVSGNVIGHVDILDKTSNYTLGLSDDGKLIQMNVSSANSITVPSSASVAFPIGTQITVAQSGTGQTTIVSGDPSVVLNATPGLKLRAQWSTLILIKTSTNSWLVTGDLTS